VEALMLAARHDWFSRHGKWLIILPPLLFLLVFFLIPFAFALKISFAEIAVQMPPFTDILTVGPDSHIHLDLDFGNFKYLFSDEVYGLSYLYSLETAFFSTLVCLAIGYPMAYAISRTSKSTQSILLLVIILPFWTSFLLRVYALEGIIRESGLLNTALLWLGVIDHPLQIMQTSFAVYLGIIYSYLPFMVLPLFATLEKLDHALLEAAGDLGSPPWRAFLDVTLPLSMPGVIAGCTLTYAAAITAFITQSLVGGGQMLFMPMYLYQQASTLQNWPFAAAISIIFLLAVLAVVTAFNMLGRLSSAGGDAK
jgi:putrescine transport system permease protein